MKFKRDAILMEVMISIEIFEFNDKYTSMQNGKEIKKAVENPYYLLAVFDAIMNTMTKANGKKVGLVCCLVDRCHFVTYQCMDIFSKSFCTPLQICLWINLNRWACLSFMTSYYHSMAREDSGIFTWSVTLAMSAYPS